MTLYRVIFVENGATQVHHTERRDEVNTLVNYGMIVADEVTIEKVKRHE